MKKILAVCGMGLGSSFMIELNAKLILKDLGIEDYEIGHSDLASLGPNDADILIVSKDLDDATSHFKGTKVVITNIVNKDELKEKLAKIFKKE